MTATSWALSQQGFPRVSGTVGFDLETRDPELTTTGSSWPFPDQRGYVVGYSLCWGETGKRHKMYLPIRHEGGGNLGVKQVNAFVADTLKQRDLTVVVHNRLHDEGWLRREGIPVRAKVYDTATAAPLLDEYKYRYSLDALLYEYVGRRKNEASLVEACAEHNKHLRAQAWLEMPEKSKDNTRARNAWIRENTWDPKEDLWRLPGNVVAPYGEDDAQDTLDLWDVVRPLLEAQELWGIFALETQLLPILIEMRWRGVRVDVEKAERTSQLFQHKEKELQARIFDMVGVHVDPMNAEHLARAFNRLDIPFEQTAKTKKPSFTKEFLKSVQHPFAGLVRDLRRYNKTRTQFLDAYIIDKHCRGRVHGEVVPLPSEEGGAVTGRFSMRSPNLENLPNPEKDFEMGVAVREIMLPEDGEQWAALDYKQQEPRLMVHFSDVMRIKGARAAVEAYRANPKLDFHKFIMDVTGLPRVYAKPINLGIGYGMGGAKLCRALGLPTQWIFSKRQQKMIEIAGPEGQEILDNYHKAAPFVKGITDECERRAKERGFIRTLLGRRCRFAIGEGKDHHYKACNRLIQGSAADQTKKAMIDMWEAGEVSLVPVHDELGCSVRDRAHAERIADIMTGAVKLRIPVGVDIEMGGSWGATVKEEAA